MITRRDFLRLAALGAGALAFRPFQRFTFLPIGTTIMVNLFSSRGCVNASPEDAKLYFPSPYTTFYRHPICGNGLSRGIPRVTRRMPEGCVKEVFSDCSISTAIRHGRELSDKGSAQNVYGSADAQSLEKLSVAQSGKIPHRHPGMGYAAHGFGYFRRIEKAGVLKRRPLF